MSIAALLGVIWHFSKEEFIPYLKEKTVPFLKKHWRQIIAFILLCWTVMCLLTHCSGVIDPWGHHSPNDTIRTVDTVMVYPDTNAIFVLHGFDTIPRHIERLNDSIRRLQSRFRPRPADHSADSTCADSIATLRNHSEVLTSILDECDEAYHDAIALRTYGDTLRNDSIEVAVNFRVEGRLKGEPSIRYRYLAPYPVITQTVTVNAPVRRQVYIDGGMGPRLTFENVPNAIEGSLGLGFVNRNNLSVGIEAGVSHVDYRVGVRVRKGFSVGK